MLYAITHASGDVVLSRAVVESSAGVHERLRAIPVTDLMFVLEVSLLRSTDRPVTASLADGSTVTVEPREESREVYFARGAWLMGPDSEDGPAYLALYRCEADARSAARDLNAGRVGRSPAFYAARRRKRGE